MNYLIYLLFRCFLFLFRLAPLSILYGFADFLCFVLYHVAGYRKQVVLTNLRNSFPGKTEQQIRMVARGFYQHLGDMLVESIKGFTLNEHQVSGRYRFENAALLDDLYRKGRPVIIVAGHYGNWEWAGIAAGTQMLHKPVGFYKPLSNRYIDDYIRRSRVQGRSLLAPITDTRGTFTVDYGEPAAFYMVADQSPSSPRLAHWVTFLGQDTAALHGPEKYARLYDLPVIFAWTEKIRRGWYTIHFEMLEPNPSQTRTGEITSRFMKRLEEIICRQPEFYLWSHRRWKLKR